MRSQHKITVLACAIALSVPLNAVADASYDALKSQVELLQQQLQEVQAALNKQQK